VLGLDSFEDLLDGDRLILREDGTDGFADVVIAHTFFCVCVCVFVSHERLSSLDCLYTKSFFRE